MRELDGVLVQSDQDWDDVCDTMAGKGGMVVVWMMAILCLTCALYLWCEEPS